MTQKPPGGGESGRPAATQGDLFGVATPAPKAPNAPPAPVDPPLRAAEAPGPRQKKAPTPEEAWRSANALPAAKDRPQASGDGAPVPVATQEAKGSASRQSADGTPLRNGPRGDAPPSRASAPAAPSRRDEVAWPARPRPLGSAPAAQASWLDPRTPAQGPASPTPPRADAPARPAAPAAPRLPALSAALASQGGPAKAQGRAVLTVGDLTRQIKGTLERNFIRVCVRGEVSGFRGANPRGHLYFSIKDAEACIDVKIWATTAQRLKFKLRDGLSVVIEGSIDVYEPQGRYSLIGQRIDPAGEGALALAFQQLKDRLSEEGLIGEKRKRPPRPLPLLPRRIGVITSISGAALRDFLRVLHRRHPRMPVLVCDARVQGDGASYEVVRALARLARTNVDVIVITRGGGSIEDLWAFNEEMVARAIHACPVPVVSAIGHEVDFTIADFVADLRAPTPSAAAEVLVPVLSELETKLRTTALRLRKAVERQLLADRQRLHRSAVRLSDPRRLLGQKRLHLSEQTERMVRRLRSRLGAGRQRLKGLQDRLARQRPEARLQRRRAELKRLSDRLHTAARDALRKQRGTLSRLRISVERASPKRRLQREHQRLAALLARAQALHRAQLAASRTRFHGLEARLDAMSPLKVMSRGYSVAFRTSDGQLVRRAGELAVGDALTLRFAAAGAQTLDDCDAIEASVTRVQSAKKDER